MPVPAVVAAAAPAVIGGALSFFGGERTNQANARMAREQMRFQERMANTSWQRGVADMKAAGLNPGLAYEKGGADAPSGTMATMEDSVGKGVSSAMEARANQSRVATETAQRLNIGAQTNLTNEQARSVAQKRKLELALLQEQIYQTTASARESNIRGTDLYNRSPLLKQLLEEEVKRAPDVRALLIEQMKLTGANARQVEQAIKLTARMTPDAAFAWIQRNIIGTAAPFLR